MSENKHTIQELYQWQALPLPIKIRMTMERIRNWVNEYGEDGVYVSFSGGKDSTVLVDIVRNWLGYKDIPLVFVDVPTQYPELKEFATSFDNVTVLKPQTSFMEVCEKYGFPLISKEVSESVAGARKYLTELIKSKTVAQTDRQTDRQTDDYRISIGTSVLQKQEYTANFPHPLLLTKTHSNVAVGGGTITSIANFEELANILNDRMVNRKGGSNQRLAQMLGWLTKKPQHPIQVNIPDKDRSNFALTKWQFMLEAPFEISNKCCNAMKKKPAHEYHKKTGRNPITAQMASESKLRTQKWLQNGCNGFDLKIPTSNPMAFWTDQDVLLYIKTYNLPICSVYGEVVVDSDKEGQLEGQLRIDDVIDCSQQEMKEKPLKTTGCSRTGCMLCGFGCHLEKSPNRFEQLKETHPGMYNLLDVVKNNGVTFREAIEWTNEHGNMDIKL